MTREMQEPPPERQRWRTVEIAKASFVVLCVWFGLQLLWSVSSLVFLVFLATLFGLAVGRGVDVLERFGIRRGLGAALIVFGAIGTIGSILALSAPTLLSQGKQLQTEVPDAVHKLETWVDSKRSGLVGRLITSATAPSSGARRPPVVAPESAAGAGRDPLPTESPALRDSTTRTASPDSATPSATAPSATAPSATAPSATAPSAAIAQRLTEGLGGATRYLVSVVSNTLAAGAAFVLMVFLAMYIGAEPKVYHGWLLSMVPAASRAHARHVMAEIGTVLHKWLLTQMIAMVVIGVVSMTALLLLDVKAPFALAFIAGLFEFIPTVGPILSAVPAILMAFVDSPEKALAVLIAYWGIQFLENNLLIPYLMRGGMDLPPAITLVAQALMTLLFGFVGLMVAVPLTATVLVPLRMLAEREHAVEKALVASRQAMPDAP